MKLVSQPQLGYCGNKLNILLIWIKKIPFWGDSITFLYAQLVPSFASGTATIDNTDIFHPYICNRTWNESALVKLSPKQFTFMFSIWHICFNDCIYISYVFINIIFSQNKCIQNPPKWMNMRASMYLKPYSVCIVGNFAQKSPWTTISFKKKFDSILKMSGK